MKKLLSFLLKYITKYKGVFRYSLLLIPFLLRLTSVAQSTTKFNDGYLTVFKVSSSSTLANTGTAVIMEEYLPLGVNQATPNYGVSLPTSSGNVLVVSGTSTAAGQISRSENGRYILIPGYNATAGSTNATFNTNSVVRTLSATGAIGTGISGANYSSGNNNLRGATSDDGTNYWTTGNGIGIISTSNGTTITTVSTNSTNNRACFIYNGQLYLTTGAGSQGIYSVGSGKPILSGQTSVRLFAPTNTDVYGFSISPDGLTIYYVGASTGGGTAGIYRATFNGSWSAGTQVFVGSGYTGIAVDWTGYSFSETGGNGARIYASNPTTIIGANDNGTGAITTTTLRTLTGNNAFRGLAFSPVKQTISKGANTPVSGNINLSTNNVVLFQFKLSADEGNSTIKKVTINQTGTATIGVSNNISNFRLIEDLNNDGLANATELASTLGTTVVVANDITFNNITLSSYINEGLDRNFLLVGDVSSSGTGATFIPSIATNKTLNSTSYTTNVINAGGSWVNIGLNAPLGNTLTLTSATPTITTNGTLNAVNTTYGSPSATPTSFTVSGANLTNNITITPPSTNFEVSKTSVSSGYADTQTLTQSGGTVSNTTIYVRLKATATVVGSPYSGNIVLSSSGATSVDVAMVSSTVTPKTLTISGVTANNKIYDGNTTASLSGTPAYNGLENGETFSVTGSPTATFATTIVGNAKTVMVLGYTAPSTNYLLTQPVLSADITTAPLTITGAAATNKIYNGNTNATITGTLSGIIGSDLVTLTGTGTFAQSDIGSGISVTSTSTLGGNDAGNYSLTQPTGLMADITAKPLTITGLMANNKVFDGNTTATLSGTAVLNGVVSGDEATVVLGGTPTANFAQSAVGNNIAVTVTGYTIGGSVSNNYSLLQPIGLVADITNLPTPVINSLLTASATYGVAAPTYNITATNLPTSFDATNLPDGLSINTTTGEITGTPTSISGSPYSVILSATNNGGTGNATLIYTINPKELMVSGAVAANKEYDRTNIATIIGTLNGVFGSDIVTLNGTATFAQSTVGTAIVVTSTATLGGGAANKYTLTQPTGLTANITAKPLTVTGATVANKVYDGNTNATISGATLAGVISPDDVSVSGNGTFASANVADGIAVTTSLTLGGTDALNYSLTQPTGITANITPAPLTISGIAANNKEYDGNTTATLSGVATLNGIIGSDDVTLTGIVSSTFNNKNIGTAKPITVTGYMLNGAKVGNYMVSQPTGLTANITAKALTISGATAQNKVFDGNTNAIITGTLSGIISPDVVTLSGTGTFASSAVGNGIEVTSTSTLGGAGASNYTLTQPTGLTANMTPAPSITELVFPQYAINGATTGNRLQYVCRLRLNNLNPSTTYRYTLGAPTAGNMFVINNTSNSAGYITGHTSSKGLNGSLMGGNEFATSNRYGELTTDATGTYEGWFAIVPSGNAAFNAGLNLALSIQLNNGANGTSTATTLTTAQTFTMLTPAAGINGANAIRGTSGASAEEMVFLYDNTAGTGRPLYGTWTENDGITTNFSTWYGAVEANNGSWGAYIPVSLANGVRRIEKRDIATGSVTGCPATDDDGVWASGANTVNPAGGTTPIVLTSADASLNTCQVLNIAPTIVMDVTNTTNYVDGGVATNITGSYAVSSVINDPTDPAQTLGIDFTISDTETAVGSLTVTATSSNTAVIPNTNLNLTGSGASRNLKITPATIGYATITVAVNDGTTTTNFIINYATSQASDNPANTRFHTGKSDASTAIVVDSDYMLVADDEDQTIRLYNRNNSGLPVNSFDFTSSLGLTDPSTVNPREVDIEASTKVGNSIYWMGSESNASNGNNRPNRNRVFKTDIAGTGLATTLTYVSRYDFLKEDILAWDANNLHGKGANYYGLVASAAAGVIPESNALDGYNIEGIEMAPNNKTAYIAFRAPQVIPSDRKKALIIPVTNFTTILNATGGTLGSAIFGTPIEINLGERGIREIRKNANNEYLIIAGPADATTGTAPKDFKLYTWTGNPGGEPIKRSINLGSLNVNGSFESIVEVPANLSSATSLQLLVDNGDAIYYNDGTIAKEVPQNNHKKFRSENIILSTPSLATGTVSGSSFCQGASVNIPFTVNNETFISDNIFTAQLSDANGSFANPITIGTLTGTTAGMISATIPANATVGSVYRIRIVSSNPVIIGSDNASNLSINVIPTMPTITPSSVAICNGSSTTLTASACSGGTLNWTGGLTGTSITVSPTTNTSYSVTCRISGCVSEASELATITVNPVPSKPTITPSSVTICNGSSTTLTASACSNGILNWTGGLIGTSTTVSPTTNTSYSVTCTISGCVSEASELVNVTVNPIPAVPSITANPTGVVLGQSSSLTATGCAGTIIWLLGGSTANPLIVTPTSNTTYTATCTVNACVSPISAGVTVTVTSAEPCQNQLTFVSTADDYSSGVQLKQASSASGKITATNKITGTAITTYQAKVIELNTGFKANAGTVFKAEIGGCN